jgi:hypothetical protein
MSLGKGRLTRVGMSEGKNGREEEMDMTIGTSEQGKRGTQKQVWKKGHDENQNDNGRDRKRWVRRRQAKLHGHR